MTPHYYGYLDTVGYIPPYIIPILDYMEEHGGVDVEVIKKMLRRDPRMAESKTGIG
jgi:hypothetical protein